MIILSYEKNDFRPLILKAGETEIAKGLRFRARGKSTMTLLPDLFIVDIYNLPEEEMAILKQASYMSVLFEKTEETLCYGEIEDIYENQQEANQLTTVVLADGKGFIESKVSKSIGAGASVRTAMASILSGYMGSFLASDVRLIRGQTFSGRLSDCVSTLAKAVNARAFFTHGAVVTTAKGQAEDVKSIDDEDIIDDPFFSEGVCIIRTKIKAYPIGIMIIFDGKQYRLATQLLDVDNKEGPWKLELTLVDENDLEANGMEGG